MQIVPREFSLCGGSRVGRVCLCLFSLLFGPGFTSAHAISLLLSAEKSMERFTHLERDSAENASEYSAF